MFLPARQPFSFQAVVHSHGWLQLAPFEYDETTRVLSYLLRMDSGRVIELHFSEAPGGLDVQPGESLTVQEESEVARLSAWIYALDQDLTAFYELARSEAALAHVEPRALGRVLRSATLFEDVVKTILTTNTQWGGTKRMNLNMIARCGSSLPGDPTRRAFPTPASIASLDETALRNEIRLGYRSAYILSLSRKIDSSEIDLESLRGSDLPTPELRKRLLDLPGIGPYAAANLLLILGRTDFIPIDSWALANVSREFFGGRPVTPTQVEAVFQRWGTWKGLVFWFWDWKPAG